IVGNGDFDATLTASGFPISADYGNCFVKLSTSSLSLLDYFTPSNTVDESNSDLDFGSGGPMVLPDLTDVNGATRHLVVGAGKDASLYALDRDNMGKFHADANNVYQVLPHALTGLVFSKPAYFNGTMYYASTGDTLKAFPIDKAKVADTPSSISENRFPYPGATPTVSANEDKNGIVWAIQNGKIAALVAYDATNVANILYASTQDFSGRDSFAGNKFITPVVANGKVYVGTPNSVVVFGILP
ncbi:MAG: pyrrolo-quinoline quinone, partial [Acidobacteriota bacterium]|nr:pyrrolo-quinoline quinone [Acidobacteriota bacterium]